MTHVTRVQRSSTLALTRHEYSNQSLDEVVHVCPFSKDVREESGSGTADAPQRT